MLKEFRSLMSMLDEIDDSPSPVHAPVDAVAVELPQALEPAAVPIVAPSTFIFDTDAGHATQLNAILDKSGVEAELFTDTENFVRGLLTRAPSMIFLDVSGDGDAAIDALFAMGGRNYAGGVQLMSAETSPVMDIVRRMGQRHSLQMLPALKKPLETNQVRNVLVSQHFMIAEAPSASLGEALRENWVEFWYQPKIDLVKRQIAGVETFARIRHPELGTVPPAVFMQGASESDLVRLSERAIRAALNAASEFARLGVHLKVAVNIPVRALFDLSITSMVRELGPKTPRWPGLVLDVTAAQLARDFARVEAMGAELAAVNVHLAIDDFGRANLPLQNLKQLPIAELKLNRNFVQGCSEDPGRAKMCAGVVELARHMGCVAVAVGIENAADLRVLAALRCPVGQGYLFGQPMPEPELAGLLLKRAVSQAAQPAAPAPAATGPTPVQAPVAAPKQPVPVSPRQPMHPRPLKRSVWN